jgi:predicted short-subunit dehydrogenase-like oxidoreductase (DUF2520 family)
MASYLRHLGHRASIVTRAEAESAPAACRALVERADVIAAAIPDDRLADWEKAWRGALAGKPAIHFSGALSVHGLMSYHPLYSFPKTELAPATMRSIAFAREEGAPPFSEIVPGATNPDFVVADADRAYYHALAVLSGNFAAFVWNEAAKGMAARLRIPPEEMLSSYFSGLVDRFRESPFDSLTGPVARRDRMTVERNLKALADDPKLAELYRAFLRAAWPEYEAPPR